MEQQLMKMMEQINKQFERMDLRFDEMDQRFNKMDLRFDNMDQRFNKVDLRFDSVESKIVSLQETVNNNATELRSHFRHIEKKLAHHDIMFELVSEELSGKR
jgi:chromosome segregation ATPase